MTIPQTILVENSAPPQPSPVIIANSTVVIVAQQTPPPAVFVVIVGQQGAPGSARYQAEIPVGVQNGVNNIFTLTYSPIAGKENIYLNGVRLFTPNDYSISGNTLTTIYPPNADDTFFATYFF